MKIWSTLGGFCACMALHMNVASAAIELHVSKTGAPNATGTFDDPLNTLESARDRIRELKKGEGWEAQPIQVIVHAGEYVLDETFCLQAEDSGTAESPITYTAAANEKVVLSGAATLKKLGTAKELELYTNLPTEAQQNVVVYALEDTLTDEHETVNRRHHEQEMPPAPIELFDRSGRLPRAGWPNTGWAVVDGSDSDRNGWKAPENLSLAAVSTAWAHGFWENDYQDAYEPIEFTKDESGVSHLRLNPSHAIVRDGARYRVENIVECLDAPGEWYYDADNNQIAVWPTELLETHGPCVSRLGTVVSMYDVEYVSLVGLSIQAATVTGVEIAGGSNCTVDRCEIGCIGNVGVNVYHGFEHVISNCEVYATAATGLRIEGGDRSTLEPAKHLCTNNTVRDCGYSYLARRAGIELHGVGVTAERNEISALPDWAIHICGNDHIVQLNHIHDVCRETSDTGAIYLAHNPTYRGNVIRNNHIHSVGGFDNKNVVAIYLDDFASETTVEGNVIEKSLRGIVIGGGRDNVVRNNMVRDCLAAIQIDSRGETWASHHVANSDENFESHLETVQHVESLYVERYPKLGTLLSDSPEIAKGNVIESNVVQCPIAIDLIGIAKDLVDIRNNTRRTDEVFRDALANDFQVEGSELAGQLNILSIPFESIGRGVEPASYVSTQSTN